MAKSTFSEEMTITGNIKGSGAVDVQGTIIGDIQADVVDILAGGRVEGHIKAETAHVRGQIKGAITATTVDLYSQADVEADVKAATMGSEKGAKLRGKVTIGG